MNGTIEFSVDGKLITTRLYNSLLERNKLIDQFRFCYPIRNSCKRTFVIKPGFQKKGTRRFPKNQIVHNYKDINHQFISENHESMTLTELAHFCNCSINKIQSTIKEYGIPYKNKNAQPNL